MEYINDILATERLPEWNPIFVWGSSPRSVGRGIGLKAGRRAKVSLLKRVCYEMEHRARTSKGSDAGRIRRHPIVAGEIAIVTRRLVATPGPGIHAWLAHCSPRGNMRSAALA
jgi:hypothetical protein